MTDKQHALNHFYNERGHRIAFNTQTMKIWWYKCDMDVVDEGPNENDSNYSHRSIQKHIEFVEELLEFLTDQVSQKMNENDGSENGKNFPIMLIWLEDVQNNVKIGQDKSEDVNLSEEDEDTPEESNKVNPFLPKSDGKNFILGYRENNDNIKKVDKEIFSGKGLKNLGNFEI